MLANNLWSKANALVKFQRAMFSSQGASKRFFMVEYVYVEDAYYKKSKFSNLNINQFIIVPHRENHLKALESLKKTADARLISSPFFPDNESAIFVQSEATEDPKGKVEAFVKSDPYVQNNIVADYRVREFAITDQSKEFERFS